MERKLSISRTSLRAYRDRAEASGKAMVDLLNLEDAEFMYSGRYPFSVPVIPVHFLGVKTDYLLRS